MHKCKNYKTCKGLADDNEHECPACKEANRRAAYAKKQNTLWAWLTTKPSRWHGKKVEEE